MTGPSEASEADVAEQRRDLLDGAAGGDAPGDASGEASGEASGDAAGGPTGAPLGVREADAADAAEQAQAVPYGDEDDEDGGRA